MEPYFDHLRKEITVISPNLIETVMAPYKILIGSWSGIVGYALNVSGVWWEWLQEMGSGVHSLQLFNRLHQFGGGG